MLKGIWFLFVVLLVYAHSVNGGGEAWHRPLSVFRDYQPHWVGYALFAVLLLFGAVTVHAAFRNQSATDGVLFLVVTSLLSLVAISGSDGILHGLCSISAMLIVFGYFAALLFLNDLYVLSALHLTMPIILLVATGAQSYGSWQKGMILYLVSATVIQCELSSRMIGFYSLTAAVLQQGVSRSWLHCLTHEWCRELVEGIEWSRKPAPVPDLPVHPKAKRPKRKTTCKRKLQPLSSDAIMLDYRECGPNGEPEVVYVDPEDDIMNG